MEFATPPPNQHRVLSAGADLNRLIQSEPPSKAQTILTHDERPVSAAFMRHSPPLNRPVALLHSDLPYEIINNNSNSSIIYIQQQQQQQQQAQYTKTYESSTSSSYYQEAATVISATGNTNRMMTHQHDEYNLYSSVNGSTKFKTATNGGHVNGGNGHSASNSNHSPPSTGSSSEACINRSFNTVDDDEYSAKEIVDDESFDIDEHYERQIQQQILHGEQSPDELSPSSKYDNPNHDGHAMRANKAAKQESSASDLKRANTMPSKFLLID
jgi:hypothetical protein